MKITPKKYYENASNLVHCEGVTAGDFTLCGFTLDGDQGRITPTTGCRINCPQCLTIIQYCRSISGRSLSDSSQLGNSK